MSIDVRRHELRRADGDMHLSFRYCAMCSFRTMSIDVRRHELRRADGDMHLSF